MEILISLTAKAAEYTVAPIGRQANHLLSYKGNFKKLADCVNELEAERVTTNHSIEHERRNMREIKPNVIKWLEEVNEIAEKANRLLSDPRCAKVGCSVRSFPNLILRHQLSRKATKITQEVVQVLNKGKFDQVGYHPPLDSAAFLNSFSTRGGVTFETRELFKGKIVKALEDSNACNIGIYGLGGVGKTTLVKEVAQIAKQHKLFDVVVMANISKTPDIKRIQGEIAEQLDLSFGKKTIAGRAYRLRQRIKAKKAILVILDDMWPSFDFEKAGIPLVDKHTTRILDKQNAKQNVEQNVKQNVCKLLITSRHKDVLLKATQVEFTFRLDLLNDEETWRLFQYKAGEKVNDSHLQNVATQVAQKCAGLPLIIVTVATGLKNKDIYAWKDALRQLESVGHAEMEEITYSALELSYKWLASDELKALFLLFASLQYSDIEYLLSVVVGLDIFKDINTVDDARDKLYTIIDSLKASCLLNNGKSGEVQMSNIVRDVAISIARRDQHVFQREWSDELKEWPTKDFLKRCPHIILYGCHIHELPQRLDCPNIKFFYLYNVNPSLEIPDIFFEGMGSLRVLDLTHLNLSSLPTSFRSLTNLQTLSLDQCILENMDAIGALKNLEILSFWKSSMIKLPKEIGNLTKIRLLDLSHSGIEVIPPNIISSLSKLEELYMGNTSIKWEDENSAKQNVNASLAELGQLSKLTALELQIREAWILPRDLNLMFEKLQRYKIAIGDVWEWDEIEDGTLKTLLMLKLGTNIHLEHGIKAMIKGVESLYLDEVDGIQNVVFQLNSEGFPLLKHLHIQNNAKIKHIVDSMERKQIQVFFNLEKLVLQNLINLEQICHGRISINSFGKLSVIKVNKCAQLKYLLSYSMVKGLTQLLKIEVCQCNSMKEMVLLRPDSNVENGTNEKIEFRSLRSLTLKHLQKLDNFFSYELTSIRNEQKDQGLESYVSASFFNAQVCSFSLVLIYMRMVKYL
jgi:Leucine-rich repeat (LRR) protein